jgi:hypothetical protein
MDDNHFDEHIRKKVAEYEEPGFDPAALADLHHRMAATDSVWPWYSRYRTELIVGTGLALCTLIILWSQWTLNSRESNLLNDNLSTSKNQDEQISRLQQEISYLKSQTPDTVKVIEVREQNSTLYALLLKRIASLEVALATYRMPTADKALASSNPLEADSEFNPPADSMMLTSTRLTPREMENKSLRTTWNPANTNVEARQRSLSVKSIRDIEDHYQKGIGIRVGPTLELSKGFYALGSGRVDVAGGVLADFILSPSLSLETGGKYAHRVYSISDQPSIAGKTFPQVEGGLGTPKNVDIDSWILEVPANLKYRYPISLKRHWLTSVGYSSVLFTRQVLEYDYELSGNSSASIYSAFKKDKLALYSGSLNFSLGLSNEDKRKNKLETSIYYQYGLGSIGAEKIQRNFLGIRSVYWFKVR